MKLTAILTVADSGPLESIVQMLNSVGIGCVIPNDRLKDQLRKWGLDTILNQSDLELNMGYAATFPLPSATVEDLDRDDILFVDVKAHRNGPRLWKHKHHLKGRTLWYRINGGKPEHVINDRGDHGDEVNIPCPILTPNLWYKQEFEVAPCPVCGNGTPPPESTRIARESLCCECGDRGVVNAQMPWRGKSFACWPPFARLPEYDPQRRPGNGIDHYFKKYTNPLCLIHNCSGWGYNALIPHVREMGVRVHGQGSPDGLLQHGEARVRLETSLAMVHLKSSDAPGYAIYEALASGCPLICSRRLIWRNRMQDLLIPNRTCLTFDLETHAHMDDAAADVCALEIEEHLERLSDHTENRRIGNAGRERLEEVMWSAKRDTDVSSLLDFFQRNFPGQS